MIPNNIHIFPIVGISLKKIAGFEKVNILAKLCLTAIVQKMSIITLVNH